MNKSIDCRNQREQRILSKAVEAFGVHGVRGASLRDIAREASVSLTLIAHHFGTKPSLVAAAMAAMKGTCAAALARLRMKLHGAESMTTGQLVDVWIDYLQDAFGSESTVQYLRLMQRLGSDPAVEQTLKASMDVAEPWLRQAFHAKFHGASESDMDLVLRASRHVLVNAFLDNDLRVVETSDSTRLDSPARRSLTDYLRAAIDATLAARGDVSEQDTVSSSQKHGRT